MGDVSDRDQCFYDCSQQRGNIKSNGDIGGIGVLLSFLLTAWAVVVLLIVYYIAVYDPDLDPFRGEKDRTTISERPNPVDRVFLKFFRKWRWLDKTRLGEGSKLRNAEATLNRCVLTFADMQIVSGTGILLSGFLSLNCGLSEYHWQLVVHFAWFASITHLSALSFLRHHLYNRRKERVWRLASMFVMLLLLSVAVGVTAHFDWHGGDGSENGPGRYAICAFSLQVDKKTSESAAFESMLITILLLTYGYAIRVAKMTKSFANRLRKVASGWREKSIAAEDGWRPVSCAPTKRERFRKTLIQPVWIAILRVSHTHLDMVSSFLAEVYWLVLSVAWGTKRIISTRASRPGDEDAWTFGQILPLALLLAPIVAIVEHCTNEGVGNTSSPPVLSDNSGNVEARTHDKLDSIDPHYEKSNSFRGLLILAIASYLRVGQVILVGDDRIIYSTHVFVWMLVLNPCLQIIWVVLLLWIEKLDSGYIMASTVRHLLFISLLSISLVEGFNLNIDSPRFTSKSFLDQSKLHDYSVSIVLVLSTWAILNVWVVLTTNKWTNPSAIRHAANLGAGTSLILLAGSITFFWSAWEVAYSSRFMSRLGLWSNFPGYVLKSALARRVCLGSEGNSPEPQAGSW